MESGSEPCMTDQTVGEFAGKIIRELQQAIIQHEEGVQRGDVEAIHNMRVGIRRMRVALSNFSACMSKEDKARLEQSLKKLAESLGRVRDLDILIASLRSKNRKITLEDNHAVSSLIKRVRARRRRSMTSLVTFIRGPEFAAMKMEFIGCEESHEKQETNGETV